MRLDKFLCDNNIGTRSQVKEYIKKGQVAINGQIVKKPETKVNEDTDIVICQGKEIHYQKYVYYMLNKPEGVVSATNDNTAPTVVSLLTVPEQKELFPVGRLDKDTEGLLLITNDGELAHRLLSPKKHVDKVYYAKVQGKVDESDVKAFADGVDIGDDTPAKSADLRILKSGEESEIELTITEGRFHQVKRMLAARGKPVTYLKRLSMGPLRLDPELAPGAFRMLTAEEKKALADCR
mgnify:CR=1 FL=1